MLCRTEDYGSRYGTAYLYLSPATLTGIPIGGAVLGSQGGMDSHGLIMLYGFVFGLGSTFQIGKDMRGWMEGDEGSLKIFKNRKLEIHYSFISFSSWSV
jgi:hypothetical protein